MIIVSHKVIFKISICSGMLIMYTPNYDIAVLSTISIFTSSWGGNNIITKSHCKHRFPWLFLSIGPYHPSLLASLPNYILCPYRAVIDRSLLVGQHWHDHLKKSIEEHHLWVRPCSSSSVPHVLFILLGWFYRWEVSGCTAVVLWGVASRICTT